MPLEFIIIIRRRRNPVIFINKKNPKKRNTSDQRKNFENHPPISKLVVTKIWWLTFGPP